MGLKSIASTSVPDFNMLCSSDLGGKTNSASAFCMLRSLLLCCPPVL